MKFSPFLFVAAGPLVAGALDLASVSDVTFAEQYALATNRAAVIASLQPNTTAWYTYSILNAQTEGDLATAGTLLKQWQTRVNAPGCPSALTRMNLAELVDRQTFLTWRDDAPALGPLRAALSSCSITVEAHNRETPLAPDTYPSVLDPKKIAFDAFWDYASRSDGALEPNFAFLPYQPEKVCRGPKWADVSRRAVLPDSPGYEAAVLAWLKEPRHAAAFGQLSCAKSLTLDQLDRLAEALKGTASDLYTNRAFAQIVLEKMTRGADDDFASDPAAEEALLRKRLVFTARLAPALRSFHLDALQALLQFGFDHGAELRFKDIFSSYLALLCDTQTEQSQRTRLRDAVVTDYLTAFCRAGSDLSDFASALDAERLARIRVETELLAGRPADAANLLRPGEFAALRDRVDLVWSRANPKIFAATDEVRLTIDVKNVGKMRVAIYDLDPFEACRMLGGDVSSDIDLDSAVPSITRTIDFSRFPAIQRHTETLILPELQKPGLYVVECAAAGRCSRALVRKGRLRAVVRRDAAGHIFTALDETGAVVKGTKLRLNETVFTADANGEILVPFAPDAKSAGRKTVVIGDGRLATTRTFTHETETVQLKLEAVVPAETMVAGRRATALLRPVLSVSGIPAPIGLLENPALTFTFTDLDGHSVKRPYPDFKLADDAETPVTFTVPEGVASVAFALTGRVRRAVTGEAVELAATQKKDLGKTSVIVTPIEQAYLRRAASGYRLELRGHNGESLPARAVKLSFKHRVFREPHTETLQTDANGVIELGALTDIDSLTLAPLSFSHDAVTWSLISDETLHLPETLTAAEGATIEIPIRDLFAGAWPGAKRLASRVSLLSLTAGGSVSANWISACSYKDGVLTIKGLAAGDYRLTLRDRPDRVCAIAVAKTTGGGAAGGVIASRARALPDLGHPSLLRIAAASVATNGVLTVKLAHANPATRVHLLATRFHPDDLDEDTLSFGAALAHAGARPAVHVETWAEDTSQYVSGRDLGEKLQYVLDRRDQPPRVGTMLTRPSLLLNPWAVAETQTEDVQLKAGKSWADAKVRNSQMPVMSKKMLEPKMESATAATFCDRGTLRNSFTYDFLPEAATLAANLRSDTNGVVTVDLTALPEAGARAQELTVVVLDGKTVDQLSLSGELVAFTPRDRRHRTIDVNDEPAARHFATVGDVYTMLSSMVSAITPDWLEEEEHFKDFAFLKDWATKSDAAKRELYDRFASHELDVFLYLKDRPFFLAVVVPHLRNKRCKQFLDKWFLEEDLSAYTEPSRLDELNAFEQCFLALRKPELAPLIARRFSEFCEAHPIDSSLRAAVYTVAVGDEGAAKAAEQLKPHLERMDCCAELASDSDESDAVPAVRARRLSRQLYRPPERTREWVETQYYQRRTDVLVGVNDFWRDYARAIEAGQANSFRSPNIIFAARSSTEALLALAVTDLSEPLTVKRPPVTALPDSLSVMRRVKDPSVERADGWFGATVKGAFVKGRVYEQELQLRNVTDETCGINWLEQIPDGAIPLGSPAVRRIIQCLPPEEEASCRFSFYFPEAGNGVLDKPEGVDSNSWAFVSQNATKGEVLAYLREKNLQRSSVDLTRIAWRMRDGDFAKKVLAVLETRGVYNLDLWLSGLVWRDAFDANRIRQVLARRETVARVAKRLGPVLVSPLLTVEPETADLFEHKEYWPLINAYAHAPGGAARIPNRQFAAEYRAFLDVLAAKKTLTADDRLLLAVYLVAQDRLAEAKAQVDQLATAGEVTTVMQLTYLKAYLAFCDGDAEKGRALASAFADHPVATWRNRFRELIAQADEIAGKTGPAAEADRAPTLALAAVSDAASEIRITSRNLERCEVKAFLTDLEVLFTKNPFGGATGGRETVRALRPAWRTEVQLADGETRVRLPELLMAKNLILVATGAEGRAEAQLALTPRAMDVQVSREYRQIRVRGTDGKPLAGTYVKVFVRDVSGREERFLKDGYTDLRGAFDYASVSTDSDFKPTAYAILVLHPTAGAQTLTLAL